MGVATAGRCIHRYPRGGTPVLARRVAKGGDGPCPNVSSRTTHRGGRHSAAYVGIKVRPVQPGCHHGVARRLPAPCLRTVTPPPQVRPAKKTAVPRLREYLGKHEPVRREYDELEFRCACGFDEATAEDREAYAQANGESIRRIIDLALGAGDRRDL